MMDSLHTFTLLMLVVVASFALASTYLERYWKAREVDVKILTEILNDRDKEIKELRAKLAEVERRWAECDSTDPIAITWKLKLHHHQMLLISNKRDRKNLALKCKQYKKKINKLTSVIAQKDLDLKFALALNETEVSNES